MNSWTTELEEDENGELVLTLPEEFVKEFDWRTGDVLNFAVQDSAVIITNKSLEERKLHK